MIQHLSAFIGVSAIVIITPGQDTALLIRNTLTGGRSGGVLTSLGVALGQAVWTLATSLGLTALLLASAPLFAVIKLLGAAYLVWLGIQSLLRGLRRGGVSPAATAARPPAMSASVALRQGLVSNLGNPKMAVFFTSLLPQFITGHAAFGNLLSLGLLFCSMTFVWLTGYAMVVGWAGDRLADSGLRRVLDGITGAVLIALGLRLAAEHR